LCDLCRRSIKVDYSRFIKQKQAAKELWCDDCTKKRDASMQIANCSLCKRRFTSSAYWFKMKRTDFPINCYNCRLSERERMRKEIEATGSFSTVKGASINKTPSAEQVAYHNMISDKDSYFPTLDG
jgi:hypothetical protein